MSEPAAGAILIDKPRGMTSHDVVDRVRRVARTRQVGHTGTLDPMADGLLVVCVGAATRIAQFLSGMDKVYVGAITLGALSSTYDAEGIIVAQDRPIPDEAGTVAQAMAAQLGERIQLPPPYSAVKVRGKKLYEYARNGEPVPQKPRPVRIMRFELVRFAPPQIHFMAHVGSGSYIRSMAHDLGLALGCGAYLSQLRRTAVGPFPVDQAVLLETLLAEPPEALALHLMDIGQTLAHLPKVTIHPGAEKSILNGGKFTMREILEFDGILMPGQPVLVMNAQGRVLSVVRPDPERTGGREDEEQILGATAMIFSPIRVLARQ